MTDVIAERIGPAPLLKASTADSQPDPFAQSALPARLAEPRPVETVDADEESGDLALTLGARGGIYIAGGIVAQWGDKFDAALFRRRFEAKGRMQSFLAPIPCYVVTAKDLAFRGLAAIVS